MPGNALIVIDMLNSYEHDDAGPLRASERAARPTGIWSNPVATTRHAIARQGPPLDLLRPLEYPAALEMMRRNMHAEIVTGADRRL
jgi:hypothetical protein